MKTKIIILGLLTLTTLLCGQAVTTQPTSTGSGQTPDPFAAALAGIAEARTEFVATTQRAANLSDSVSTLQGKLQLAQAQIAQLQTAAASSTQPAFQLLVPMPDDVVYTGKIARQYCIAIEGNDTRGRGTQAAPFATISRALKQVAGDRQAHAIPPASAAAIAEISYKGGEKFTQDNIPIHEDHLLFDSYGAGTAEIDSSTTAFGRAPFSPAKPVGLHLQYLDLVCIARDKTQVTYGLWTDLVDDVSADYCSFSGFTFNVAAVWQTDGLRLAYNYSERAAGVVGSQSGSGFYANQASHVQCYGNFHYHEGWDEAVYSPAWWADITSPNASAGAQALLQTLFFFHGEYWRDDAIYVPVDTAHSFFIDSACTGLQIRTGGTNSWSVYQSNGNAADCFSAGVTGGFDHIALFGETFDTFPHWGQGIILESVNNSCRHVRALSQSKRTQNALIEVRPANVEHPSAQPVPTTQAVIDDVAGVWPVNNPNRVPAPAAVWVDPKLAATTTATNIAVRAAAPGEHLLTMLDIYNVPDDQALADLFRANFRGWRKDPRFTAQYVWDRADRWIRANP
jgi:hypothetical protein